MAHIHTGPGQIDFIAEVFCVYRNTVLFRLHDKYHIWIAPGGHVELDETPEEAAVREVKEETGLDVALWDGASKETNCSDGAFHDGKELILPAFANVHSVNPEHRHISLVYFGKTTTNVIVQPETHEKSECKWLTRDQLLSDETIAPLMKKYALAALWALAS